MSITRARVSVTGTFFLNGAVFSSWYARLPAIQEPWAGPPATGLLAEVTDLRAALALVCLLCAVAAALAAYIGRAED